MTKASASCAAVLLLFTMIGAGGCGSAPVDEEQLSAQRAKFLLAAEPSGVLPVMAAREMLIAGGEIVVLGQVGGVPDPWDPGRASFMVVDPSFSAVDDDEGHVCMDSGCAFCANKKEHDSETLALIRFVDERGEVVPVDARKLFGIERNQMVVVRGQASVDGLGHLVVSANGLYIRR